MQLIQKTTLSPLAKFHTINRINKFLIAGQKLAGRYETENKPQLAREILRTTSKVAALQLAILPSVYCSCGTELRADIELKTQNCMQCNANMPCRQCGKQKSSLEQNHIMHTGYCFSCDNVN